MLFSLLRCIGILRASYPVSKLVTIDSHSTTSCPTLPPPSPGPTINHLTTACPNHLTSFPIHPKDLTCLPIPTLLDLLT